jgi:hypothetical protein
MRMIWEISCCSKPAPKKAIKFLKEYYGIIEPRDKAKKPLREK